MYDSWSLSFMYFCNTYEMYGAAPLTNVHAASNKWSNGIRNMFDQD